MGRKTSKNKEKDYGGLSFLIECQYDVKYLSLDKAALYYHTLLKYWQEYNHDKFSENSDIQNKIIWNNSRILIGGKPIFYKPLFQAQIISIKHLLRTTRFSLLTNSSKKRTLIFLPHFTTASSLPFQQSGKSY